MKPDWLAIESEYREGRKSVNAMAAEHGVSEGAVRKRAKKLGWIRDAAKAVRTVVNAHLAVGTNNGTSEGIRTAIDAAASSGIADMEHGLRNARAILGKVSDMLDIAAKPAELKTLNDANLGAIETIRRIRQLDDPAESGPASRSLRVEFVRAQHG